MKKQWIRIIAIIIAVVIAAIEIGAYLAQEPLRGYIEAEMNRRLKSYTVRINKLSLHPLRLSIDLENMLVSQKAHPDPPVAEVRRLHASVHWLGLLTLHLVGDAKIEGPKLYINPEQLISEQKEAPVEEESWQDALQAAFPLTINEFKLTHGELTYVEEELAATFKIQNIKIVAGNIRNVRSPDREYPSDIFMEAGSSESGTLTVRGKADFLSEPAMSINAEIRLENFDVAQIRPIAQLFNVTAAKGIITANAGLEFSPKKMILDVKNLTLRGGLIDYLYAGPGPRKESEKAKETKEREALIHIEKIRITESSLGLVNKAKKPPYRVYMNDIELVGSKISNKFTEGAGELRLKGNFMGSGETTATATFRPEKKGPDFTMAVAVKNTRLKTMNDLFRAYGNFDVTEGLFSVYSELTVKDNAIKGYVKPLFRDMKVYDRRQDKDKGELRKLYEGIVGGVAKLFENQPRKEAATETSLSGKLENPDIGTWTLIENLFQNAFVKAILPGFERNIE